MQSTLLSINGNLILTTSDDFIAQDLLKNERILRELIQYKTAKGDKEQAKVVVHGVPLQDVREDSRLAIIKEEIKTFNKSLNLKLAGNVHWLTTEEKRLNPKTFKALIIVLFKKDDQVKRAIRHRLILLGVKTRVKPLFSAPPTY